MNNDNALTDFLQEILDKFKAYPEKGYALARCPFHDDKNPSLSVNLRNGRFRCFSLNCGEVGGLLKLTMQAKGLSKEEAQTLLNRLGLLRKGEKTKEAEYFYWYEDGTLAYKVVKYRTPKGGKTFEVLRYDYDKEEWKSGKGDNPDVLYNLEQVLTSDYVIYVEGEKDVETLKSYGFVATTHAFGAGNFKPEFAEWLEGKTVYLMPDNDEAGVSLMREIALALDGKANLFWIDLSPLVPEKGDISDLVDRLRQEGKTEEEIKAFIRGLLDRAEPYIPEKHSLLWKLSVSEEDLESTQAEFLIDGFLPKGALVLWTAKYGGGKSLSALAMSKKLLGEGVKVVYLDMDNSLPVVAQRLKRAELTDAKSKGLFYIARSKAPIHHSSDHWKRLKKELSDPEQHYLIIVDTLKNFSKNKELNSDKDMGDIMDDLMKLRDANNTVLVLHHVPKAKDDNNPFKNSATIVDSVDVAYELIKDDNKITFRAFKDRIPVESSLTFEITEDFELKPTIPPHLQVEIEICEEILKSIPPEGRKQGDLVSVVKDRTGIGKHKVEETLTKYEGVLWEVVRASRNAKIYQRKIDPYQFSKNPYIYIGSENWETQEPQGFEASRPEKSGRKTGKLNGDNDLEALNTFIFEDRGGKLNGDNDLNNLDDKELERQILEVFGEENDDLSLN